MTPEALPAELATSIFQQLLDELDWQQERVTLFGRTYPAPRLTAWYGASGYRYAGIWHPARPLTDALRQAQAAVEKRCQHRFNSVLANLYRDGNDAMGWHADDEPELGPQPVIASLSLGAKRDFQLRPKDRSEPTQTLALSHNSLLLMHADCQPNWQHALPRRALSKVSQPRINLTFRLVHETKSD